jgi:hypothetical protein
MRLHQQPTAVASAVSTCLPWTGLPELYLNPLALTLCKSTDNTLMFYQTELAFRQRSLSWQVATLRLITAVSECPMGSLPAVAAASSSRKEDEEKGPIIWLHKLSGGSGSKQERPVNTQRQHILLWKCRSTGWLPGPCLCDVLWGPPLLLTVRSALAQLTGQGHCAPCAIAHIR